MPLRLLATADLHLGRAPSRLPDELVGDSAAYGPAGAWERCVDRAVREGVDAVLLAGDIVEHERDYFEGYRRLREGARRLREAGIRVLAVSGNHDVHVLPRLAEAVEDVELLGAGGRWEQVELRSGSDAVTVWGWSFPRPVIGEDPLADSPFPLENPDQVVLGLLHCDRDQIESRYAPVRTEALARAGVDAWLLGHIHVPDDLIQAPSSGHPGGYLGSLTALHPADTGPRGPWLLSIAGGRIQHFEHWPMAPLRWERLEVDVTDLVHADDLRPRLLEALQGLEGEVASALEPPDAVGLRIRLTGRCSVGPEALEAVLSDEERAGIHVAGGTRYFVERISADVLPQRPLEELAAERHPAGLLAHKLLVLDRPPDDPERRELLQEARPAVERAASDGRWSELQHASTPPAELDDDALAQYLQRAARLALDRLLWQKETA